MRPSDSSRRPGRLRSIELPAPAQSPFQAVAGRRSPRFRRVPLARDEVFDHGRATAPRLAVPHMLPSTMSTISASARLMLSRFSSPPDTIAVDASPVAWPLRTQRSLPGRRYALPRRDFHPLERASFAWRTDIHLFSCHQKKMNAPFPIHTAHCHFILSGTGTVLVLAGNGLDSITGQR